MSNQVFVGGAWPLGTLRWDRRGSAVFALLVAASLVPASARASDVGVAVADTNRRTPEPAGQVVQSQDVAQGAFVYSDRVMQLPLRARFAIGGRVRDDYTFFSPQEQEALLALRQRRQEEIRQESRPLKSGTPVGASVGKRHEPAVARCLPRAGLEQAVAPRIVARADSICVPELKFSDAPDWREHLVCTKEGVEHGK